MAKENVIQIKSYAFALKIATLCLGIMDQRKEYVLSKQLMSSGTSIGANVEEAIGGQSRKDFISKLSIAYKESRESHYWIRLLTDLGFIETNKADVLKTDCEELKKLLASIIKSSKNND